MPDTPETRSVVEAAEQAAAAGDYASAEARLREAARLQASLGPSHPDLANTLNNLGVVCEITGKPEDAERCFRQAWAIAATILPPGHPFVATSRKNLEDFCAAHGKAVDSPPPPVAPPPPPAPPSPPPAVAVEPPAPKTDAADRRPESSSKEAPPEARRELPREAPRPVAPRRRPLSLGIGALIAAGLFVTFIATTTWFRSSDQAEPASGGSRSAAPPGSPATAVSPSVEPDSPDVPKEAKEIAGGTVREPSSVPPARRVSRPTPAPAAQSPVVADARLCRELSTGGQREWQCVPPSPPVGPGPLSFYTRIKSPTDTTVEHRWYRGDRLHHVVELRIRANTGPGYRTYSRNTIGSESGGNWRVELRTEAGVLLHEERFVVR